MILYSKKHKMFFYADLQFILRDRQLVRIFNSIKSKNKMHYIFHDGKWYFIGIEGEDENKIYSSISADMRGRRI